MITPKKIEITPIEQVVKNDYQQVEKIKKIEQIYSHPVEDSLKELSEIISDDDIKPLKSILIENFGDYCKTIDTVEDLKKALNDLFIRFNTEPKKYTKNDFWHLIRLLCGSLIHLYLSEREGHIEIGKNLGQIVTFENNVLNLKYPVATDTVITEDKSEVIPSVDYLDNHYVLKWGEI